MRSIFVLTASAALLSQHTLSEPDNAEAVSHKPIENVVVTATREAKPKNELAESVTVFDETTIQNVSPSHPSELLNRSAGVYVNNLGGEGHMTAIRQPITTRGVYLYLEDGIPVRPTGFFNHNALYEVNIPQSGAIEAVKGPGSALYGSDAIGGMINSLTTPPPEEIRVYFNGETGSHGWRRGLISVGNTVGQNGIIASINHTTNEGFREESEYDRMSFSARWDYTGNGIRTKSLLSYTEVDQSGTSSLEIDEYRNNTTKNLFHDDVAFRDVEALRISSEVALDLSKDTLLTFTPFYRDNTTRMAPSWMITYDPNERENNFESFGVLTKYRINFSDRHQLIAGLDLDYSPSEYREVEIAHAAPIDGVYSSYNYEGRINYDFEGEQTSVSPYFQYENRWRDNLIATFGLRYDYYKISYENNIDSAIIPETSPENNSQLNRPLTHRRPDSQNVYFDQLSPKFGLVHQYSNNHEWYLSYRHAFSIPSVGTLFRSGSTQNTDTLEPIKADSYEIGLRGRSHSALSYEIAVYSMQIKDDIVSVIDGFERNVYNAGETKHDGIELSLFGDISHEFSYAIAFSRTKQKYETFSYTCCFPSQNIDVSGNDVGKAPKTLGNINIAYAPQALDGLRMELELSHVGKYFTDETNTQTYDGHDLYNFRVKYQINDLLEVYGRVMNLADELYSTYTTNQVNSPNINYRPGLPRTYYGGLKLTF